MQVKFIPKYLKYALCIIILMFVVHKRIYRCQQTTTMNNITRYFTPTTQCPVIDFYSHFHFRTYWISTHIEKYIINTVYSIYMCDEYQHLGKKLYCQLHVDYRCYFPSFHQFLHSNTNIIFTYFDFIHYLYLYYHNDIVILKNDIQMCCLHIL